jgi:hypothetical protein
MEGERSPTEVRLLPASAFSPGKSTSRGGWSGRAEHLILMGWRSSRRAHLLLSKSPSL